MLGLINDLLHFVILLKPLIEIHQTPTMFSIVVVISFFCIWRILKTFTVLRSAHILSFATPIVFSPNMIEHRMGKI